MTGDTSEISASGEVVVDVGSVTVRMVGDSLYLGPVEAVNLVKEAPVRIDEKWMSIVGTFFSRLSLYAFTLLFMRMSLMGGPGEAAVAGLSLTVLYVILMFKVVFRDMNLIDKVREPARKGSEVELGRVIDLSCYVRDVVGPESVRRLRIGMEAAHLGVMLMLLFCMATYIDQYMAALCGLVFVAVSRWNWWRCYSLVHGRASWLPRPSV